VRWPSGKIDKVGRTNADQSITIEEGRGVVRSGRIGTAER
jgi:hypothetical protein